jgi:hypothetical protein
MSEEREKVNSSCQQLNITTLPHIVSHNLPGNLLCLIHAALKHKLHVFCIEPSIILQFKSPKNEASSHQSEAINRYEFLKTTREEFFSRIST